MAVVDIKKIAGFTSLRKKLNRDMTIYPDKPNLGAGAFPLLKSGIYQMRPRPGGAICVREVFYNPGPPTHPGQIAAQKKFAEGVSAWQKLDKNQKMFYNRKAKGLQMSGYNYFLKIFMLSSYGKS